MRNEAALLRLALILSVVANLFLGGLVLGGRLAPSRPAAFGGFAPAGGIRRLNGEERALWRRALAPHRSAIRASRTEVRSARSRVVADLGAEPLDRPRLEADLAALRAAAGVQQAAVHAGLLDAMSALPPAARRRLIQSLPPPDQTGVGNVPGPR